MKFRRFQPSNRLRDFVRHYWIFEIEPNDLPFSQKLFPFGSFELILNIDGAPTMQSTISPEAIRQPPAIFPGQFTQPFSLTYTERAKCLGVSFSPWVGHLLFGVPAYEFTDRLVDISLIERTDVVDRIGSSRVEAEAIEVMETFLEGRLLAKSRDNLVRHIALSILNSPSREALRSVLSEFHITRRRIEQRFLLSTGLTMGQFMKKVRFHRSVHSLSDYPKKSLTEIALEGGYFDQGHFIKDFKNYTGCTPSDFVGNESGMVTFVKSLMPLAASGHPRYKS